jgi:hypothetical protein
MKKGLLVIAFIILSISPAYANCPEGSNCAVDVNCTTGVVTYRVIQDAPVIVTPKVEPVVITPTHTLAVQTSNQTFSTVGTISQIETMVNQLVAKVTKPVEIDPCTNGGCYKSETNATTQVTTVSLLTASEIKARSEEQTQRLIRDAELAKVASQALPNIQPIEKPTLEFQPTLLSESEPDWWEEFVKQLGLFTFWFYSFNWFEL